MTKLCMRSIWIHYTCYTEKAKTIHYVSQCSCLSPWDILPKLFLIVSNKLLFYSLKIFFSNTPTHITDTVCDICIL